MKPTLILTLLMLFSWMVYSQSTPETTKVIVDPLCEVRNSGIYHISKIELNDRETRLTMHCTFVPYWWVSFSKKEDVIRDPQTGKTYEMTDMEGGKLDQQIWMKGSGDSTFVLIYPPIDKSVKKIDWGKSLYGISLLNSNASKVESSKVPADITKWIDVSLAKVKGQAPINFNSDKFFSDKNARLIGYIKGYDQRLGFTTGLVYTNNELTREDYPTVVQIYPDGHFEADLPFNFPKYSTLYINDKGIPFYIEPGQTLSMIIDWEEFLNADRMRNIRYRFKNVVFGGPLAKINNDIAGFTPEEFNYQEFRKKVETLSPEDFKNGEMLNQKAYKERVESYIKNNKLTPQATLLLRNSVLVESAVHLFDYVDNREYMASQDTANKILKLPVPDSYFDFLKEIPMNDKSLLACTGFSTFINRFEFSSLFKRSYSKKPIEIEKPKKDFLSFLMEEGVELSQEDKELVLLTMNMNRTQEENKMLEDKKDQIQAFYRKHQDQLQAYSDKYLKPLNKAGIAKRNKEQWHLKDSLLQSDYGLKPNLVYEITKVRSLQYVFEASSPEAAKEYMDYLLSGITNPYLIETGQQLYKRSFPEAKTLAYTLPNGTATDIFRKIVDPFKGKILFIDFWATTCGPCVGGIKRMQPIREKYKDNKDFDFIFITDERSSPTDDYNKFVQEQGMKNIYRLTIDDYNYLRQLFKFNGIPHYTVLDREGKVINNNFPMHNFEYELKGILSGN